MTTGSQLDKKATIGWSIRVRGTVQGVGFRPTVYKLALESGITGRVFNDGEGVLIEAWSSEENLQKFEKSIWTNSPPLAKIESIEHALLPGDCEIPSGFSISKSEGSHPNTQIAPDAATCADCLEDTMSPFSRRFRYPFTNCTHCGPRLSIIKSIPYDRASTSMATFKMCEPCQKEYDDPANRRFHAQPNACHVCGPKTWLERSEGGTLCLESMSQLDLVDAAATLIQRGEIVAVKGIGGFHLACDATNDNAVDRLRSRKNRYHKPFALMAKDIATIERYCAIDEMEKAELQSRQAPIVVLNRLADQAQKPISNAVAPGQKTLGFMLPYTPLHHLLMKRLNNPIVLTSGNLSQEPQSISNEEAKDRLAKIADYFLLHNRDIINRLDDSVVRVVSGHPRYLRRARGATPAPIPLPPGFTAAPEILAMGGELKNTFCLIKNSRAIQSQHIGDLEEAKTFADYRHNLDLYLDSFKHETTQIAVDLHPEYMSTKFGRDLAKAKNLPLDEIQHHHAHVAACLAENAWPLDAGPVLGVALDGLGFGNDGTFWGGEFLLADYTSFERLGTFKPVALIGGSKAMQEPWRNTYAHIMAEMGWPSYKMNFEELELTSFLESKPLATLESMLKSKTNSPLASSCGRLFDAAAAAAGICRDSATYEGQAAVEFEACADLQVLLNEPESLAYPFSIPRLGGKGIPYVEPLAVWQALLGDLYLKTSPAVISARFHKGLAKIIVQMIDKLCARDGEKWLTTVALTGGVFQNRILHELVETRLTQNGYKVLTHSQVPANDAGISLGQALISAAKHLNQGKERQHVSWHTWANS